MTDKEIYVINRALDGKDIYMMPPLQKLGLSEVLIQGVKEQLIINGILVNFNEFTTNGVLITKKLKAYKDAYKYVTINNITIGIGQDKQNVMLMYNPLYEDYKIEYVNIDNMIDDLISTYKFLEECIGEYEEAEKEISLKELENEFDLGRSLYFKTKDDRNQKSIEYKVFSHNNCIYVYDYKSNTLKKRMSKNVIKMIREEIYL